jgi:transcriptional regulator with XRE-family HTH domain/tetratricopeptide (TPR) repeat protein
MAASSDGAARLGNGVQLDASAMPTPLSGGSEIVIAREIRARGLVAGLPHAKIAEQIHEGCGPVSGTTWIRAYRLALGISLADVVAQVRAWYASEGREAPRFSETLLSAYESGQKRPGPEYLHYLCAVYRAAPSDLGYPGHCFCGRAHRDPAPAQPKTAAARPAVPDAGETEPAPDGAEPPAQSPAQPSSPPAPAPPASEGLDWLPASAAPSEPEAEDDDDVLRRTLLRLIAYATSPMDDRLLRAADRIRRRMDDALVGGTVSAAMLDQWEETTASYGRQYMTAPPLRLLCDVLLDFGDVRRMCERRQPLESSERLCRLAAQLAGLAGMTMINVGHQRLARAFFRTARTAADETGDRHLRAWVVVREAFMPLYYGDPGEACTLARTGSGLAGHNPSVAGAMGPMLEARSVARSAGEFHDSSRKQALRRVSQLLCHATDAICRLPAADRGDTAFGYTERQLLFHQGDTLVTLGDHDGAEKAFTRALKLYSRAEILDRSLVTLGLARCRMEADEPEEALRLGRQTVLGIPREHRSEILVRMATSLGDCVAGRFGDLRAVREYRQALIAN